ncbi:MAG: hypothetical protein N7Q72_03900, partial [Spiroplasma sp. Tabriz.8]|nr:hypothetical protein [Spiroplasma sp. Tabriz.8]
MVGWNIQQCVLHGLSLANLCAHIYIYIYIYIYMYIYILPSSTFFAKWNFKFIVNIRPRTRELPDVLYLQPS